MSYSGSSVYLEFDTQGKVRPTHGSRAAVMTPKDLGR